MRRSGGGGGDTKEEDVICHHSAHCRQILSIKTPLSSPSKLPNHLTCGSCSLCLWKAHAFVYVCVTSDRTISKGHGYSQSGSAYKQCCNAHSQSGSAYKQCCNSYSQSGSAHKQCCNAYSQSGSAHKQCENGLFAEHSQNFNLFQK